MIIFTGKDRHDTTNMKKQDWDFKKFCERIQKVVYTDETEAEYAMLTTPEKGEIKDVGGYVAGDLTAGRRKKEDVKSRSMLILDLDYAKTDTLQHLEETLDFTCIIHSTHSSTLANPRYRICIPLKEPIACGLYPAMVGLLMKQIGRELFDGTCDQPARIMYWPSCCKDAAYTCKTIEKGLIDVDQRMLDQFKLEDEAKKVGAFVGLKQQDPTEKEGIVGVFCRNYNIPAAIEAYLSDIYVSTTFANRYDYTEGKSYAGLVLYDDDNICYSHHDTDPAAGRACNAFDLVRLHKFPEISSQEQSTDEMINFLFLDPKIKKQYFKEKVAGISDSDWYDRLARSQKGLVLGTMANVVNILINDIRLKSIRRNELNHKIVINEDVPFFKGELWGTGTQSNLLKYLGETYAMEISSTKLSEALAAAFLEEGRSFNPVQEFILSKEHDGVKRAETYFIDWAGVEDTAYARDVTIKTLMAIVARNTEPNYDRNHIRFDYMIVLSGAQGIGKSTVLEKLGLKHKGWFTNAMSLDQAGSKAVAELIQGKIVIEVSEMVGVGHKTMDRVKAFITRTDDEYRECYDRNSSTHARRCVLFCTTNDQAGFMKDATGNRRLVVLNCHKSQDFNPASNRLSERYIQQVLREAYDLFQEYKKEGFSYSITMNKGTERGIIKSQELYYDADARTPIVELYLDKKLPENWKKKTLDERVTYIAYAENGANSEEGVILRNKVTILEIWVECFCKDRGNLTSQKKEDIKKLMIALKGWKLVSKKITKDAVYGAPSYYFERV